MSRQEFYSNQAIPVTVAIPTGATGLSASVQTNGLPVVGLIIPSDWVIATAITLQGSIDGTTFYNVYDDTGTEVSITVAASRHIALNPSEFASFPYLKLRSGTAASPTDQTNSPELKLVLMTPDVRLS